MRRIFSSYGVLAALLVPVFAAHADYLVVSRSVTLKDAPSGDAAVSMRLEPGAQLPLLDNGVQTNGYYHARGAAPGLEGWVYRTFVRRFAGDVDEDALVTDVNPLADPTFTLTPEGRRQAERHLRIGKPQAVHERVHEGYVFAHDARLKIPVWVQYELSANDLGSDVERRNNFHADTSIPFGSRSELGDYLNSGFDRGHMAPAEDMSRTVEVMSESFLLTNMAPQVGAGFNNGVWKSLERAIRGWVSQRGSLTIITGPVFAVDAAHVNYQVIGANNVAVASHFYKIVVDTNDPDDVDAVAFLLPNERMPGRQFSEFISSIDEIESLTGLDFLASLSVTTQDAVESEPAENVW